MTSKGFSRSAQRGMAACLALLSLAPLLARPLPGHAQGGPNLLENADFGWPMQENQDACASNGAMQASATTPHGWKAFWSCKTSTTPESVNHAPHYRPMNADLPDHSARVRSYPTSLGYYTVFSMQTHAGVLQQVRSVKTGDKLRFSLWVQIFSTNVEFARDSSREPGGMHARVCIDTTGNTTGGTPDFASPAMVCSPYTKETDKFLQISVDATAAADQVTVLLDSGADYPVKHNDVFADDAELVVIAPAQPPSAPVPASVDAALAPTPVPLTSDPTLTAGATSAGPRVTVPIEANIRSAPTLQGALLTTLGAGESLPVTAITADRQWWQVQFNGATAYVNSAVVTPNTAAATAAAQNGSPLPAFALPAAPIAPTASPPPLAPLIPTEKPAALANLAPLSTLPVITTTQTAAPTATAEPKTGPIVMANTGISRLIVRAEPSPTGAELARVANGTRFTVLDISSDHKFWKVRTAGAAPKTGWVMVQYTAPNEAAKDLLK